MKNCPEEKCSWFVSKLSNYVIPRNLKNKSCSSIFLWISRNKIPINQWYSIHHNVETSWCLLMNKQNRPRSAFEPLGAPRQCAARPGRRRVRPGGCVGFFISDKLPGGTTLWVYGTKWQNDSITVNQNQLRIGLFSRRCFDAGWRPSVTRRHKSLRLRRTSPLFPLPLCSRTSRHTITAVIISLK